MATRVGTLSRAGRAPRRRRVLGAINESRGTARIMLWVGVGITLFFVLLAIFAPVISPYGFDQYQANGHRFAKLASSAFRCSVNPRAESSSWHADS